MRNKNRKLRKSKVVSNIIFNIIALISTIVALVFCVYIYKLDMIPSNYLTIVFIAVGVIYLLLLVFTLPRKIKTWIKIVCAVFFIIFAFVFGYGIKYTDSLIDFVGEINKKLMQTEDYQLKVLKDNNIAVANDLKDKKVGVYKNNSYDAIVENLNKEVKCEIIEYTDPVKLFQDLQEKTIDGVVASDHVYELLETELSYMKLELVSAHVIPVPVDSNNIEEIVKVVDVTNTPFNIFLAGGDAKGSINKVMNTDVNMVISVDPVNHKILLTSIPRDYYVHLPGKGDNAYDKLTHAGYYGVQESILAVEELLDTDINYYAKVNFSTIEKVVDALGGIDVYSDKAFTEDSSHNYFRYKKGINHLNGERALAFARERHAFKDGDIQRVKNQQAVINAIMDKVTSFQTVSNFTNILDAISKYFATNLDSQSINRLIQMQLSDMRGWSSDSQNLVGTSGTSKNCYSIPNMNLYVMKQDKESVNSAIEKIKNFMNGVDKNETNS